MAPGKRKFRFPPIADSRLNAISEASMAKRTNLSGLYLGVGIALGTALGLAFDNLALGIGLGIAIGAGLGFALSAKNRK